MKNTKNAFFAVKSALAVAALALFAAAFSSCGGKTDSNGWYTDFETAQKVAKRSKKSIVLFVNSDNDDESTKGGVNLLVGTKEFTKAVSEDFVCVHFDFVGCRELMETTPDGLTSGEQKVLEKKQKNFLTQARYADDFNIHDTPATVIISKDGYYITDVNFDYLETSVSGYKSFLYYEIGTVQDFEETLAKTKTGSIEDRVAAYDDIFSSVNETVQASMEKLWKEAINLDKKNQTGKMGKYITVCATIDARKKIIEGNLEDAIKIYQNYASDVRLNSLEKQVLLYFAAQMSFSSGVKYFDKAIELLDEAIALDPESIYQEDLVNFRDLILDTKEDFASDPGSEK